MCAWELLRAEIWVFPHSFFDICFDLREEKKKKKFDQYDETDMHYVKRRLVEHRDKVTLEGIN